MTDLSEGSTDTSFAPATAPEDAHPNTRLYQVLAWVGIVAGILFIVAAVFFSGFFAGRTTGGYGWHQGAQMGGGCPMMQMQPGGMGPGMMPGGGMGPGMMPGGGMGPSGMRGPAPSSTTPMSPPAGQR